MSNQEYNELIKEHIVNDGDSSDAQRRKRRRIPKGIETIEVNSSSSDEPRNQKSINSDESDEFDSDDFQDVEFKEGDDEGVTTIYDFSEQQQQKQEDSITVELKKPEAPKAKRKFVTIGKEERQFRLVYHKLYLACMIVHGMVRNRWCCDRQLYAFFRPMISSEIKSLLFQDMQTKVLTNVRSRRFMDGIQKLMLMYSRKFKCVSKGIIRKNWNELSVIRKKPERNMTISKFRSQLLKFKGSRDLGAQGFVCMLRAAGLNARLVFSLQPPDYTSIAANPATKSQDRKEGTAKDNGKKTNRLVEKFRSRSSRDAFLSSLRQKPTQTTTESVKDEFEDSEYPIFWVEVFNKYSKKWLSVDPIVLKTMEVAPMRRKSKFEPPLTEQRNQLNYAIAFDQTGKVKDVTRRYSQFYNAKTIKKKIQYKSTEDEHWYNRLIEGACLSSKKSRLRKTDVLELKEFHDRDLAEGFPNNIQDFKNHPLYALDCQLRQDEIIHPKDDTSKCGMFRPKTTTKKSVGTGVHIIYKRSSVHKLRSARRWFMLGRVLKIGVQPLKIKQKSLEVKKLHEDENISDNEDGDEDAVRLYAEFQTQLYVPPPIKDGIIPKNAYGNIDIYVPSMIPENGFLITTGDRYPKKLVEKAAYSILNIDYAKAVVGFDFGNQKKHSRKATVREGGILVDKQYKEAMLLVIDHLIEEEEDNARELIELQSLKNWKFFLTNLRIVNRLNKTHGTTDIDSDVKSVHLGDSSDSSDSAQSKEKNPSESVEEFFPDYNSRAHSEEQEIDYDTNMESGRSDTDQPHFVDVEELDSDFSETSSVEMGGGFLANDSGVDIPNTDTERLNDIQTSQDLNDEAESVSKFSGSHTSDDGEYEDLPDDFFIQDENGELVYNPKAADYTSHLPITSDDGGGSHVKQRAPSVTDPEDRTGCKSSQESAAKGNLLRGSSTSENNLQDASYNYPNITNRPGSQESVLSDNALNASPQDEGNEYSENEVQVLEEEEEKFGFDYSDSE